MTRHSKKIQAGELARATFVKAAGDALEGLQRAAKCVYPVGRRTCGLLAGFACQACGPMCYDHFSDHGCPEEAR